MQLHGSQFQKLGQVKKSPGLVTHPVSVGSEDVRMRGPQYGILFPVFAPITDQSRKGPFNSPFPLAKSVHHFRFIKEPDGEVLQRVYRIVLLRRIPGIIPAPADKSGPSRQVGPDAARDIHAIAPPGYQVPEDA